MGNRVQKNIYLFISDQTGKWFRAQQQTGGTYVITKTGKHEPVPLDYTPVNLLNTTVEFGTNDKYFSLVRTIHYPLEFIKDGAAILRHLYHLGKGTEQMCYLTIIEWNGSLGYYELSYYGRIDLSAKKEDPKSGRFIVPVVDDSAWGVLSQKDTVEFSIDCSPSNPKAIRVLFDGITLLNKATFQTVQANIIKNGSDNEFVVPFVLVNQDGDSAGMIIKNQTYTSFTGWPDMTPVSGSWFLQTAYAVENVQIYGSFIFQWSTNTLPSGGLILHFYSSTGQRQIIFANGYVVTPFPLIPGHTYKVDFDFTWDLAPSEKIWFLAELNDNAARLFTITPIVTNITVSTLTIQEPEIRYGLRPLDALQDIVKNATDGRFSINSEFLTVNNKKILFSGDSLRNVPNARLYSSFFDFYKTFNSIEFMSLRTINRELWLEKATEVYGMATSTTSPTLFTIEVPNSGGGYIIRIFPVPVVAITAGANLYFNLSTGMFVVNTSATSVTNNVTHLQIVVPFGFPTIQTSYPNSTIRVNGVTISTTVVTPASPVIINLGEVIDVELEPATDYLVNEIKVGSPKQDYRHASGRLEFNSTNSFSLPIVSVNKAMDIVTKYRLGCYDIQFLLMDYQGQSSEDNTGDKAVYVAEITDEIDAAVEDVQTFENINVNNAPLQPYIKTPSNDETITYNKPVVRGIAPAGSTVNIYVDTIFDGTTVADVNGNWSYNINTALTSYDPGVETGVHVIDATYTDLVAPVDTVTIRIDTTSTTQTIIAYPAVNDSLYNNKPLIKGYAQKDTPINVFLDTVLIGSTVADASCKWELQSPLMTNGNHTLVVGSASNTFNVDAEVAFPLITYIGSELDGFPIINNLPLVKGVALPGTLVKLWLNYIPYAYLGTAITDANGNWEFQVVDATYLDPLTGVPVILAPIRNGLSVLATLLINQTVGINVKGYKLLRPGYSLLTGVIDNTVFNTTMSPKRMLLNHAPMLASIMQKQPQAFINFQTADKNGNLATVLDGVFIAENTDVPTSELGEPIALLEYAKIKTKTYTTFAKTLENFNNGGLVQFTFRGTTLYALPIGSMKMSNVTADTQEWKLLMSPMTKFMDLLNLYKNGLILNIMKDSLYHSDYNTLHFVTYNHTQSAKYNFKTLYDDWFENRNDAWVMNPRYVQKVQTTDPFRDQLVTHGVSNVVLRMYRCSDASLIEEFPYSAVASPPIPLPEVVLETGNIDLSVFPEDQYFFVLMVGSTMVAISERIETKVKWEKTILIESYNSINYTGAFFSTGMRSVYRVEGLIKKLQPDLVSIVAREENGNTDLLYSNISRKRVIRFGTAYGLPDYLYLKIANALAMDGLMVEGVYYSLEEGEKIQPSEDVIGHPLYYYDVNLTLQSNQRGKVFSGGGVGADTEGVILVIDAEAMGLPRGSLINIEAKGE